MNLKIQFADSPSNIWQKSKSQDCCLLVSFHKITHENISNSDFDFNLCLNELNDIANVPPLWISQVDWLWFVAVREIFIVA